MEKEHCNEDESEEVKRSKPTYCKCEFPVPSLTVDGIWCCLNCGNICEKAFKK